MRYATAEFRFLLDLARGLLNAQPKITNRELARQLGVSVRSACTWRQRVDADVQAEDPLAKARQFLECYPNADVAAVAKHLGLQYEAARGYRQKALEQVRAAPRGVQPLPPSKNTYEIPQFLPKKRK